MVRRKGAGYLIEGMVSVMVLLIFVSGALNTLSEESSQTTGIQEKITSSDATYVLKKTEKIDRFVERGETGSIRAVSSALTGERFDVSGSVKGSPTGRYFVGVFVEDDGGSSDSDGADQVRDWSLNSNLPECNGDLEEINSESQILRYEPSGGSSADTLYFADADSTDTGSGTDYDTLWVDNGTQCQFLASEGPHRLGDFVKVAVEEGGTVYDRHYQLEAIRTSGSGGTAVMYRSPLTHELKKRFSRLDSASIQMDRFNFSETLSDYDLLIFKDRKNLNEINNHQDKLLRYTRFGKTIFAMEKNNIQQSGTFLSRTGMETPDMSSRTRSGDHSIVFGTSELSQEIERYYGSLGPVEAIDGSELNPIVSGQRFYSRNTVIAHDSKHLFDRDDWNVTVNASDTTNTDTAPEGVPTTDCDDAYMRARKEFREDGGYEPLTIYSTKLSGTTADCDDTRFGISIDKNDDGDFTDPGEEEILEGERTVVNGRRYYANISSHDSFELLYNGEPRKEVFSHTSSFETQNTAGFGFAPGLSFPEDRKVRFLAAASYAMLEGKSFGPGESSSVTTTAVGRTAGNITYRVNLRWLR
ncbi:MAG: hypothetical protein ABEJ03_01645 [Candidatus Nanohaloarchaea archaeon]